MFADFSSDLIVGVNESSGPAADAGRLAIEASPIPSLAPYHLFTLSTTSLTEPLAANRPSIQPRASAISTSVGTWIFPLWSTTNAWPLAAVQLLSPTFRRA